MGDIQPDRVIQLGALPYSDGSGYALKVKASSDGRLRIEGPAGDLLLDTKDWAPLRQAVDEAIHFAGAPTLLMAGSPKDE